MKSNSKSAKAVRRAEAKKTSKPDQPTTKKQNVLSREDKKIFKATLNSVPGGYIPTPHSLYCHGDVVGWKNSDCVVCDDCLYVDRECAILQSTKAVNGKLERCTFHHEKDGTVENKLIPQNLVKIGLMSVNKLENIIQHIQQINVGVFNKPQHIYKKQSRELLMFLKKQKDLAPKISTEDGLFFSISKEKYWELCKRFQSDTGIGIDKNLCVRINLSVVKECFDFINTLGCILENNGSNYVLVSGYSVGKYVEMFGNAIIGHNDKLFSEVLMPIIGSDGKTLVDQFLNDFPKFEFRDEIGSCCDDCSEEFCGECDVCSDVCSECDEDCDFRQLTTGRVQATSETTPKEANTCSTDCGICTKCVFKNSNCIFSPVAVQLGGKVQRCILHIDNTHKFQDEAEAVGLTGFTKIDKYGLISVEKVEKMCGDLQKIIRNIPFNKSNQSLIEESQVLIEYLISQKDCALIRINVNGSDLIIIDKEKYFNKIKEYHKTTNIGIDHKMCVEMEYAKVEKIQNVLLQLSANLDRELKGYHTLRSGMTFGQYADLINNSIIAINAINPMANRYKNVMVFIPIIGENDETILEQIDDDYKAYSQSLCCGCCDDCDDCDDYDETIENFTKGMGKMNKPSQSNDEEKERICDDCGKCVFVDDCDGLTNEQIDDMIGIGENPKNFDDEDIINTCLEFVVDQVDLFHKCSVENKNYDMSDKRHVDNTAKFVLNITNTLTGLVHIFDQKSNSALSKSIFNHKMSKPELENLGAFANSTMEGDQ